MSVGQQTPAGVSLFNRTTGQSFSNSNLSAAGRDHINLSINFATGGTGQHYPSPMPESPASSLLVVQPSRPPVQRLSFLNRVYRRFRICSRMRPRSGAQAQQEPDNATRCLTQAAPEQQPIPGPPPPSPSSDMVTLPDGSSIASFDSRSQSPLVRPHGSSEEEVYECSLLPKGQGFPLFNPPPFARPVKLGDFGTLGQDGFESFGNLFDPNDQREFSIYDPPQPIVTQQPEKLHKGQVITTGTEDARRLTDADNVTNRFEFHFRESQGATLALTSSGDLETLTPASRSQLREYLCSHGTQLMIRLRQKHHLQPGQSLYVVTGTIKSDSWAIAVHTSPMREPYNQMVLSRREAPPGATFPTYEWTRWGNADARCGTSKVIDEDGQRSKDQCLFLRGFLLTPSLDLERLTTSTSGNSSRGDSSSSPDSTGPENSNDMSGKGGSAHSEQGKSLESNDRSSSSEGSLQHQLQDIFQPISLVQPFPAPASDSKPYYPSQRINDTLLEDPNISLAITHDDDWRDRFQTRDGYLGDEALSTFMMDFWEENLSMVSQGVATTIPVAARIHGPQHNGSCVDVMDPPTSELGGLLSFKSRPGPCLKARNPFRPRSDWNGEEHPTSLGGWAAVPCGPKTPTLVSQSLVRITSGRRLNHQREGQVRQIESLSNKRVYRLEGVPLEESSADIRLHLEENPADYATAHTTQQTQQLVSNAAGLFIYAATVTEYLKNPGVEEQKSPLNRNVPASSSSTHQHSHHATAQLDRLYLQILESWLITEGIGRLSARRLSSMLFDWPEGWPSHSPLQGAALDSTMRSFGDGGTNNSRSNLDTFQMLRTFIENNDDANQDFLVFPFSGHGSGTLLDAAEHGDEAIVKMLLELDNIQLNAADLDGRTPLMWASGHDNKAFFEMLLERDDIQPNAAGKDGQTPLNLKRQTPTKNTTLLLSVDGYQGKGEGGYQGNLCHGLVRVEKENRLIRLFHNAAKDTFQDCLLDMFPRPHSHLAEVCIAHLSNCGFQGTKLKSIEDLESTLRGDSLLAIAYSYNAWASHSREPEDITSFSDRLAEFVAGCHAFPVAICEDRQFEVLGPLHVFAFFDLPIALAGPKAAYNSNIQTRTKGLTSLSLACYARSTWAVDELLGLHAVLVNQPANDGCTPLQWGSWRDYKEVVKELLVHRETQVNLTNKTGQTPLALASRELQYQAQGSQMIARYDAKATKGEQDIGQHHGQLFKRAVAWGNAREMWSDTALTQCSKGQVHPYVLIHLAQTNEGSPEMQPEFYEKLAASELKFFVTPDTSRTVEAHVPEVHRVIILAQERDLDIHIDKEIRCSSLLAALEKGRSEIVASLKEKASGMFLHASLQLEALQRLTNMQDVREILIMFPAGIEDLNLRTRMGHWVASQMISKVSLPKENPLWVIPGAWSLTGDEWRHPLATSPETDGLDSSQQEILVGLGVGLMTVEDTPLSPLVCYTSKGNHGRLITETFPRPHVSLSAVFSDQLTDIRPRRAPALESSFPST